MSMELTIALALSILSSVIAVSSFVLNRKDKAVKDVKDEDKEKIWDVADKKLIEYKLEQLEKKLDKILEKLDTYDKEIEDKINKALDEHIKIYHKGE